MQKILPLLLSLTGAAACTSSSDSNPEDQREWNPLPGLSSSSDGASGPVPTTCGWALSADEVIWGTIVDVRLLAQPAVRKESGGVWWFDPECVITNEAMAIDVAVEWSHRGQVSGTITFYLGALHKARLVPMPRLLEDGSIHWPLPPDVSPPLAIGQPIGAPLQYVAEFDAWSLMGESMFALDAPDAMTGQILFQQQAGASTPLPPPDMAIGLTSQALRMALMTCEETPFAEEAAARKQRVRGLWGPEGGHYPDRYFSATCIPPEEDQPVTCTSTADCPKGLECETESATCQ